MTDDTQEAGQPTWGPAMEALTDKQRAFVLLSIDTPLAKAADIARSAGYKGNSNVLKVFACRFKQSDKFLEAMREETEKRVKYGGLIGISGLIRMAEDPDHPSHFKACDSLADRGGFGAVAKQEIKVERTDYTGAALVERIKTLARQLGVDETKLLGGAATPEIKVIEGEVVRE